MKQTKKYYFSVEGETEKWYLEWLMGQINQIPESRYKVSFDCSIEKNPYKYVKKKVFIGKTEIYHISDYESSEPVHEKQFKETMDNMKKAEQAGKNVVYKFGYTNLTFDLWIILHKMNCNASYVHRKNYIEPLNRAFGTSFENMDEYKHENNFKRCLKQLDIVSVLEAISRAKEIMKRNEENGYTLYPMSLS